MYSPIMAQTSTNRCPPLSKQGGKPTRCIDVWPTNPGIHSWANPNFAEGNSKFRSTRSMILARGHFVPSMPAEQRGQRGRPRMVESRDRLVWLHGLSRPFFGSAIIIYHGLFMKFPDTCPCCFGRPTGQNMAHCLPPWLMTHQFSRLVELLIHMYPLLSLFGL